MRFRKCEHLRTTAEFQAVYDRRRSASDPESGLLVYGLANTLGYSRIGLSVSRKYGGAVQRVRIRRLLREAFRLEKLQIPTGLDFILIPRGPMEPSLELLRRTLVKLTQSIARKMSKVTAPARSVEQPR